MALVKRRYYILNNLYLPSRECNIINAYDYAYDKFVIIINIVLIQVTHMCSMLYNIEIVKNICYATNNNVNNNFS